MVCEKCNVDKNESHFYFKDGGLGVMNERISICKDCINDYNNSKIKNKYLDAQIQCQYYGAIMINNGSKMSDILSKIDNGIKGSSNRMGIQNFLFLFDKTQGLPNVSKQTIRVYNQFTNDLDNIIYPDEVSITENQIFTEGSVKQVVVNFYERDKKGREECIRHYGYDCSICGFNFETVYGEIGKNFIHVHHLKPLSEIKKEYQLNPIKDLRPVCPNCHSMLHKKIPAYSIEEIKKILKSNGDF